MIELIQFPWSPFCIVQRRILEFSGTRFKITNIPNTDRSLVWKLTREQYYQVPVLRDGRQVIFETAEDSQVIAKYLDNKLGLGLFPEHLSGWQTILWQHIENEIESLGFRLNDIYYRDFISKQERLAFVRHKERKFGRGCLERWREERGELLKQLEKALLPYEQMLLTKGFLIGDRPHFADFDLYGMLGNFLASGNYQLPAPHKRIRNWHARMTKASAADFSH
ncbi:MAG: glutathione S-transferase family protein [Verrucomicrobia bacterium]|nr:glutathione S-transferase family protein [Verrucomicrobiota bacterium]